jgi:hypothetical protein
MIYGMLGLFEEKVAALIKPDYSLPVAHVYAEYAKAIITARKNLSIIYQYGPCNLQRIDWPSWVPDFRDLDTQTKPRPIREERLSAGGSPIRASFSDDGYTLICQGVLVDELEDRCYGLLTDTIQKIDAYSKEDLRHCLRRLFIEAPWKCGSYSSVPMTSLSDLAKPYPASEGSASFLGRNEAVIVKGAPLIQWLRESDRASHGPVLDAARRNAELGEVWEWLTDMNIVATKAGRLGLTMIQAERGDKIAILEGCNVQVLLRPSSKGLRLVGACYIDGLMDGEALRDPKHIQRLEMLSIY